MNENSLWRDRPEFIGTILSFNKNSRSFDVLLDDGRTITASISIHVVRLMFIIKQGDRVRVKFRDPPKSPRIVGFY